MGKKKRNTSVYEDILGPRDDIEEMREVNRRVRKATGMPAAPTQADIDAANKRVLGAYKPTKDQAPRKQGR